MIDKQNGRNTATKGPPAPQIFIGRQAIFDRNTKVVAYELLYRGQNLDARRGDEATSRTLLNAFIEIGLQSVAGPHPVLVKLTRHFFTEMPPLPFDPDSLIVEIEPSISVDEALLNGVAKLRAEGFRVAIGNYCFEEKWDLLLPQIDMVKIDTSIVDLLTLSRKMEALHRHALQTVADKVETPAQFKQLLAMDIDRFQGYFFARPQIMKGRRLTENQATIMRLLARLNDPAVRIDELEELIAQDPAMSYKVLRYVNSAAIGLRRQIESIRQAVIMLGLDRIRAWASLFALSGAHDKPIEIINLSLVRANLCEAIIQGTKSGDADIGYTVGLLSVLDALMDMPLEQLVDALPLPQEIADAIVRKTNPYGEALACALAMELQSWDHPACKRFPAALLQQAYVNSTARAFEALEAIRSAA